MTDAILSAETLTPPRTIPTPAVRLGPLQTQLLTSLREQDLDGAGACFERLVGVPGWVDQGFNLLRRLIKAEAEPQRIEMSLLAMLLQTSDLSFKYIKFISTIIALSAKTDQENAIYEKLSALVENESAPPPRSSNMDFILHISRFDPKHGRLLAKLKYKGAHPFDSDDILGIAGDIVDRFDLPPSLEERLHAAALSSQSPRQEWAAQVKQAFAIDTVLADRPALFNLFRNDADASRKMRLTAANDLLDQDEIMRGFKYLNPALGTLVTGFHGGFVNLTSNVFFMGTKNGLMMARIAGPNLISNQDPKAALFQGVRSILDGQSIFVAADARAGKYKSTIRILDVDVPVADGAPFIAYETNCETVWLGVERSRHGFTPVFAQGPSRREGERFVAFRERWLSFYAYQIHRVLTGDPRNLTLRMQWATLFSKRLDPNQIVA